MSSYRMSYVSIPRIALLQDVGNSVPEVTLMSMLTSLLPPVPNLNDVCKKLQDNNHVTGNRWKRRLHPSKDKAHGLKAFKNLKKIYNNIHASCSGTSGQRTVKLTINDHSTPLSSRRNSSCPDGFSSVEPAPTGSSAEMSPNNWFNICWALEVNKKDNETEQLDNWMELVHVFLALGSASHADLGFDPTMQLVCMDAERTPVYEIDVMDVNSRVWKVVELPCPGGTPSDNFLVLKDCWIELDCRHEHTSLADLCSRLNGDPRLKHFLTVITACVIQAPTLDKNGVLVLKPDDMKEISINAIPSGRRETKRWKIIRSGGVLGPAGDGDTCSPDVNYADMLLAVQGALTGVGAMHDAGYLHHDEWDPILLR
ncbi:hypothetical protein BDP27DRAFT_1480907 [Rhodocollybia butyracea]|uniref:Uncharacterized protein n=1 Tax=Rhodocollybia butyracea TaxID=206335 RepID=A0A9P5UB74_9AGAR|nr:hypothetical protein BDP27DRAFT_1480907 [Rhodocollybia butyracea]